MACLVAALACLVWPAPRQVRAWRAHSRPPDGPIRSAARSWLRVLAGGRGGLPSAGGVGDEDVADALVLVALGLRAGLPLVDALRHVRAGAGDAVGTAQVGAELGAVVAALEWGRSTHEAWDFAGPRWRAAATAAQLSERTGAAAADLLEHAAGRLRERRERDRERAAARAGVLLVLPLGLGFLPAFACTAVVPLVATLAAGVLDGGS